MNPAPRRPASGPAAPELAQLLLPDAPAWERWLEAHHAQTPGVWLQLAKRGAPITTVTHAAALEVALCFGWVDSQIRPLDEHFTLRRFTPRRPRSTWSQVNREAALALIAAGRMRPAGAAQVAAARSDGRWDAAYAPQSRIEVPADLQAALDAHPAAREFFQTLTGSRRYAFLYRLHHVTDPARRHARIADYITRLSERRTLD